MENSIEKPLVSVIVPCYNHAKYITRCINSIINQTYKNIELIVIDDGSSDNSLSILQELNLGNRFLLDSQKNIGLAATINKGIKNYVTGKYLIIIASDDYMKLDRIENQVDFFEKNPSLGFIFSMADIVDENDNVIGRLPEKDISNCSFDSLLLNCYVPALTAMLKTEVFAIVGLYDEQSYIEDWDMWLKISAVYEFKYLNVNVANYRLHSTNISGNYKKMIASKKHILSKWLDHHHYLKALNNVLLEELSILAVKEKKSALIFFFTNVSLARHLSYYKSFVKLFTKFKL
ncbi:glycosyltransferase [Pedobacter sp. R20-19]|uniref:glycosyltransferase n=1 Tax=Pedobacter sp. R20-19 TaxID=1270196 RepID=UPI00068F0E49|nr:glycosyltransferase [Pedobacter sp. R20-19]